MGDSKCSVKRTLLEARESHLKAYQTARKERLHLQAGLSEEMMGEVASKHLSARVRERKGRTQITELKEGGSSVTGVKQILGAASEYFRKIFGGDRRTDFTSWDFSPTWCLSEGAAEALTAEWPEQEVKAAFAAMAKNKSPGGDGPPKELFEAHWDLLGESFMVMAKSFEQTAFLPMELKEAAVEREQLGLSKDEQRLNYLVGLFLTEGDVLKKELMELAAELPLRADSFEAHEKLFKLWKGRSARSKQTCECLSRSPLCTRVAAGTREEILLERVVFNKNILLRGTTPIGGQKAAKELFDLRLGELFTREVSGDLVQKSMVELAAEVGSSGAAKLALKALGCLPALCTPAYDQMMDASYRGGGARGGEREVLQQNGSWDEEDDAWMARTARKHKRQFHGEEEEEEDEEWKREEEEQERGVEEEISLTTGKVVEQRSGCLRCCPSLLLLSLGLLAGAAIAAGISLLFPWRAVSLITSYASTDTLVKSQGALTFLVVGDWGRNGDYNQSLVAEAMGRVAAKIDSSFVISTGDNFYEDGLTDSSDPQFTSSFSEIYQAPSLRTQWYAVLGNHNYHGNPSGDPALCLRHPQLTSCLCNPSSCPACFMPVLGNHDYHGNPEAQLDPALCLRDPRWRCERSYNVRRDACPKYLYEPCDAPVELFFIDTSPMLIGYWKPSAHQTERLNFTGRPEYSLSIHFQIETLRAALASSTAKWKIVIGHHPVRSTGENGDSAELVQYLNPILKEHQVDFYMNGHDHNLELFQEPASSLFFVTSGAGSQVSHKRSTTTNPFSQFYYAEQGFVSVIIDGNGLKLNFHDIAGTVIHTLWVDK
ncbi:unnamed protein product [Closterium sp. NIES-65]|nr:unnamed protein product [Closterium sp. NIES-65]